MRKKQTKWLAFSLLAVSTMACLGGALSIKQAVAETSINESTFTMYQGASVRTEGTNEHPNATGLRFKTYASAFRASLNAVYPTSDYAYSWYTQLRFTMWDGVSMNGDLKKYTSYESNVPTSAWNEDGWNTVLLNIPDNALAIDITAQSFVEIKDANGATVYEMNTDAVTYSAAQTASWGLAYHTYKNEQEYAFLLDYVDTAITNNEVEEIRLNCPILSVEVDKSDNVHATSYPAGYGITYTSDKESVATVDSSGRVTGVSKGTANITLSIGSSIQKVCQVNVRESGDVPTSISSWNNTTFSWNYFDQSSAMYPFYKSDSSSGTGKVVNNKIQISDANTTAYYTLNSKYLDDVFGLSYVKAVRIKLTGLTGYTINQFMLNYASLSVEGICYEKDGDAIWLQFNRGAYETFLKTRASDETPFKFRFQLRKESGAISGSSAIVSPPTFYVEEISPVFDGVTEDFEYGMPSYITTDAESTVEKISERTNGRGMYALNVQPTGNSLTVDIASEYADKVFASGATALQFRVYTDKDLSSVTVNGSTQNVQYKYNADGKYYTIRIGSAYGANSLKVVLTGEMDLGELYIDAFTGTNDAIGENRTKTQAYAADNGGEPTFKRKKTFNFFAYSSLSDGKLGDADYAFDELSLETMLELKEVGFDAIMPQSYANVDSGGRVLNHDYIEVMDLAYQAGLKVVLTDSALTALSGGHHYDNTRWKQYYDSEIEVSGTWQGAAVQGTAGYEFVKSQLSYYINHPAFMGVVVKDEPSAWMFDENLPSGAADRKSGAYGFTYKTIKRVALEIYGKDIYIHANLLPAGSYSNFYKSHEAGQAFPELTVKRYGEITGMDVSDYAVDGSTDYIAETGVQFYTDLENYVDFIGASSEGNNAQAERDMWMAIQRERFGAYCELFLQATGAPYLMADLYPMYGEILRERSLMELQTMAEVAAANGVELHIVTQTMTHLDGGNANGERLLAEADLRWMNNTLLSYGVKNIVYFTYHVRATQDYDTSFVDETGEKTKIWYAMQEIMSQNKAFASTYQSFDIQATKTYYKTLSVFDGTYGRYANDIHYRDGDLYLNDTVSFTALTDVEWKGELTMISEFKNANNGYMYAIMNVTDGKYRTDTAAYEQVKLTFGEQYTHAVVWRDGEKTLVVLDENNALEIENAAGEAVYVIPYVYKTDLYYDEEMQDNGAFFPMNGKW